MTQYMKVGDMILASILHHHRSSNFFAGRIASANCWHICLSLYIYIYIHTYEYVYICIYIYLYVCVCAYVYVYMYVYVYAYAYVYVIYHVLLLIPFDHRPQYFYQQQIPYEYLYLRNVLMKSYSKYFNRGTPLIFILECSVCLHCCSECMLFDITLQDIQWEKAVMFKVTWW